MIDSIIAKYLQTSKRLVIPEFGAFIRKDGGEIVFVEFLKKDDQILSRMVRHEYALDEHEAREAIDGYILNIRKTVGATGRYIVEGIGYLHTDPNGLYALTYDPAARNTEPAAAYQPEAIAEPAAPRYEPQPEPMPEMIVVSPASEPEPEEEPVQEERSGPEIIEMKPREEREDFAPREPRPEPQPKAEEKKAFTLNDLYSIPATEEPVQHGTERPHREPAQHHPDPRQEQTPANPTQRQYDDAPARHRPEAPVRKAAPDRQRPVNYRKGGKGKVDIVMIVAIAAALIAIGAIIFGMVTKNDPAANIKPTQPLIENTVIEGEEMEVVSDEE